MAEALYMEVVGEGVVAAEAQYRGVEVVVNWLGEVGTNSDKLAGEDD